MTTPEANLHVVPSDNQSKKKKKNKKEELWTWIKKVKVTKQEECYLVPQIQPNLNETVSSIEIFSLVTSLKELLQLIVKQSSLLHCVPTCFACLRAHVPTCLTCLRAHVLSCLACLRAHVPTCLACSRAHMPMCLACLSDHMITCSCLSCSRVNVPCVVCEPTYSLAITTNEKYRFSTTYFLYIFVTVLCLLPVK